MFLLNKKSQKKGMHTFKIIEVKKGISELGYTGILLNNDVSEASAIVIKGAFDLMSEIKNNEEE